MQPLQLSIKLQVGKGNLPSLIELCLEVSRIRLESERLRENRLYQNNHLGIEVYTVLDILLLLAKKDGFFILYKIKQARQLSQPKNKNMHTSGTVRSNTFGVLYRFHFVPSILCR